MPDNGESRDLLESWKEVAAYLKRDVRTVQRWEKSEKLPVHRHMHGTRGTVSASKQELDAWSRERNLDIGKIEEEAQEARDAAVREENTAQETASAAFHREQGKRRNWLLALAIVTVGLLTGFAGWLYHSQRARSHSASGALPPVRVGRFSGIAFSEEGRIPWIPLGGEPFRAIRTPNGAEIYIAMPYSNSIKVFDTRKNAVTGTIQLEGPPVALAVSPDGKQVYAGSRNANLSVIQVASKAVTRIETNGPVFDIAVTPDGEKAYLAMELSGLKRLWLSSGKLEDIPTVKCPVGLALSPNGTALYVSYQCGGPGGKSGHDAIGIFDMATDKFRNSITGFPNVGGPVAVSPDGAYLWVSGMDACAQSDYDHVGCPIVPGGVINLFNTASNTLVGRLGVERLAVQVSLFPDGSRALVFGGDELIVISTATQATLETLPIPGVSSAIFSPDSRHAYIISKEKHAVAVIDIPPGECEPISLGLSGFWPGDGNANDVHRGLNAQMLHGATFAAGRVGSAFKFDGHGAYARIAEPGSIVGSFTSEANPDPSMPEEAFAFGAWLKLDNRGKSGVMTILDKMPAHDIGGSLVVDAEDHFRFCFSGTSSQDCFNGQSAVVASTTKVVAGRWFHVMGVKSLGKLSIYVNAWKQPGHRTL
jgi:YVTN family beta-propeller protein